MRELTHEKIIKLTPADCDRYLKKFPSHTTVQLRFNDVDPLGHVNNSVYQQLFDLGRLDYFTGRFEPPLSWDGPCVIVARLEVDFLSPITLEMPVRVATRIVHAGNKSLRMEQCIYHEKEKRLFSRGISVMVAVDRSTEMSIPLLPSWRASIENELTRQG